SPYLLALVANALLAMDPKDPAVKPYLDRLLALKQSSEDGQKTWWAIGADSTTFYGSGRCGDVETTALAVLALIRAEQPQVVRPALTWIVSQRQLGHWGSTQATILALKALLLGTGKPDGGPRRIEIALGGQ